MVSPIRPLPRRVYLIGGWRRWLVPGMCGPVLLLGLWLLTRGDTESMTIGGVLVFAMALAIGICEIVMRLTRLEITPEGVVLKQVGYRLESPWSNVRALRTDALRQGFILDEPLTSKGAKRMAFASGLRFNGAPMYDEAQQELLLQGRLIPIEAFGWHLEHGSFMQELRRYAPYLEYQKGPASRPASAEPLVPGQRRKTALVILFVLVLIGGAFWAAIVDPPWVSGAMNGLFGVGMSLLAVQSAAALRNAWRAREWFMLVLFTAMVVINTILALYGLSVFIDSLSRW